ncbi:MAG: hypothetical protein HFP81_02355 [Methylococcales symbiont of Hymedesmia sp. n. MRB-2018]|nr:MAG: hypothetical protein HFP81_02355 [Methylococcales symbiont of Hymedesmia sp. n. MRB-2018]
MEITNNNEISRLALLLKWQNDSPEDRHQIQGVVSNKRNTQTTRLGYVLNLMVLNNDNFDSIFQQLARYTLRQKDRNAYLSKDSSWMREPYCVKGDWFFEGCTSLKQKKGCIQYITKIQFPAGFRFSTQFADCAADFIANENLEKYKPAKKSSNNYNLFQENVKKFESINFEILVSL